MLFTLHPDEKISTKKMSGKKLRAGRAFLRPWGHLRRVVERFAGVPALVNRGRPLGDLSLAHLAQGLYFVAVEETLVLKS